MGGRYVRGVFGDRYYVKRVAALALEFRWSLARDLYKISVFHDLAVYGELDREHGGDHPRVADAFGLNLYYSFGFTSDGKFDRGVSASISKAF